MLSRESYNRIGMLVEEQDMSKGDDLAVARSPGNKSQGQTALSYVAFCDFIADACCQINFVKTKLSYEAFCDFTADSCCWINFVG